MKKTLLASAIALTSVAATNANANMVVTQMNFSGLYAASGNITDDGGAYGQFTGSFFGHTWVADQITDVFDNTGSFAGSNSLGAYDYSAGIAAMGAGQVAVGTYFDWNTDVDIPVLAIFDCAAGVCTGDSTNAGQAMQTGPFVGSQPAFNGTGSLNVAAVPVPAAVWLMGSGLLGLVGVARRRKVA